MIFDYLYHYENTKLKKNNKDKIKKQKFNKKYPDLNYYDLVEIHKYFNNNNFIMTNDGSTHYINKKNNQLYSYNLQQEWYQITDLNQ